MKDAYFNHFTSYRKDSRVRRLLYEFGCTGYGVLWICIEKISQSDFNKCSFEELKNEIPSISIHYIESLIDHCIESALFIIDSDGFITTDLVKLKIKKPNVRMYNTNVKLWYEIRKMVFERDNYTCNYCGKKGGKLEADHIKPFSKGGPDELINLVTSCRRCNRQKKDKSYKEFMAWKIEHLIK